MKLTWGEPFWRVCDPPGLTYAPLDADARCDALVVGAGITGALICDALVEAGVDTILLDKREPGAGSTGASTALLLYELDVPLHELIERVGASRAIRAYQLGIEAIGRIERLTLDLPDHCGFSRRKSVYLASTAEDAGHLQKEFETRRQFGFCLELLGEADIASMFSFSRPAALVTDEAAQIDPYRLTHQLLARSRRGGLRIFAQTQVRGYEPDKRGICAVTANGHEIRARRIIYATGYEAAGMIGKDVAKAQLTYALAGDPVASTEGWWRQCLLWETARPYLYLRLTPDGRPMIGGADDPGLRFLGDQRRLRRKGRVLQHRFQQMFPRIDFTPAAAWAGVFETTPDGMARVGKHSKFPNAYFALGYGGNGITFGVIAARILTDLFLGRENRDAQVFRFG